MSNLAYQVSPKKNQHKNVKVKARLKKKSSLTVGEKFLITFLVFMSALGCMLIISKQAAIIQMNNDIRALESEITAQEKVNSGLYEEITELSKPERILQIAKQQGLTINNNVQVIGD
ncbi:cell division protein FtsL [Calidifontibacillus erzurumensis]|uniref:Cell division protein FtsL n=1 Tax=Calidifontibacillus erzurumensis TaxID=2741433 RepID=A0A8J8GFD4_9BACI|nr:cell division protein FtsL [Calidifontibacillus erzurumensis]NSL50773.1 cell division protein FtsL [Calidifontibacillus erzurumensis]